MYSYTNDTYTYLYLTKYVFVCYINACYMDTVSHACTSTNINGIDPLLSSALPYSCTELADRVSHPLVFRLIRSNLILISHLMLCSVLLCWLSIGAYITSVGSTEVLMSVEGIYHFSYRNHFGCYSLTDRHFHGFTTIPAKRPQSVCNLREVMPI